VTPPPIRLTPVSTLAPPGWRSRINWGWAAMPALLVAWMLTASRFPSYVLPQPWEVAEEAWRWVESGRLWAQLLASLWEELGGFGAAVVVGFAIGTGAGLSRALREFVTPLIAAFMSIPPIAWAPLAMILFGLGYTAIMAVIFIAAVFPIAMTIQQGVEGIRAGELRAARVLGASRLQLIWHVVLPASLPAITAALRIGFSQAWRALVAAEMIGATHGIGWMVSMGGQTGNASQVLLGIVLIGAIAWLMETLIFRRLERRYQHWRVQEIR
jgi:ABC-type nitrate/sulfonate/bicarbonate transport system permease component